MILSFQVGFPGLFSLLYCVFSQGLKWLIMPHFTTFAGVFVQCGLITVPLWTPRKELKPEEIRWQDGDRDITAWRKMQGFNAVPSLDFNTLPYAGTCSFPCLWILSSPIGLVCVSASQTPVLKTSMRASKLSPLRNVDQATATASVLGNRVALTIVRLCVGRGKCSPLTVSFGPFRVLQIFGLSSGFPQVGLTVAFSFSLLFWTVLLSPLFLFLSYFSRAHTQHAPIFISLLCGWGVLWINLQLLQSHQQTFKAAFYNPSTLRYSSHISRLAGCWKFPAAFQQPVQTLDAHIHWDITYC